MVSTPQPVFIRNSTPNVWSHLMFIYICVSRFLYEVQSFSSSNRMSIQILATVFGPNILRAKAEDPQSTMGGKMEEQAEKHLSFRFRHWTWQANIHWGHVLLCRCNFNSGVDAGAHQRTRVVICQSPPPQLHSSTWKFASISQQSSSPAAVTLLPPVVSASDLRELQTSRTVSPGQQVTEHLWIKCWQSCHTTGLFGQKPGNVVSAMF